MSHDALATLIERWINDAQFRTDVRADPIRAIERAGVELSEPERAAVAAFDWSLPDRELAARASRMI
jgi:hypothetical protein